MSSESVSRKKRNGSEATPAPDGDHRKRRRNRTTQSCLNCHTSKRMCDRKRPACARCTQLGLTGLCVYEVDDPSQRSDTQDESSRLLKRVAELEGVIRELKNKPHPRWVQSGNSPGEEFERWHARSQCRENEGECPSSTASSPPASSSTSSSSSEKADSTSRSSTRSSSIAKSENVYPPSIQNEFIRRRPSYCNSSPLSTPSPSLMTPTEEFSQPHIAIANNSDNSAPDYDLASMFLSYPALMGCDDSSYANLLKESHSDDSYIKQNNGHCSCLHEPASYSALLELSLRLRKAADILARSPSHHAGSGCFLYQRISDLDSIATNALGNVSGPPEDLSGQLAQNDRNRQINLNLVHPSQIYNSRSLSSSTISPQSLQNLRTWDLMPTVAQSPSSCDDSFMTWEPPRRP